MKELILNKNFCLLFFANLVTVSAYLLTITVMARYAVVSFACSDSLAGLAASIFMVGGLLGRVVVGRYANIIGEKNTAVISLGAMFVFHLLYLLTSYSYALLLVVRVLHGVVFGVGATILPSLVLSSFPKDRMGEGTGIYMLSTSIGTGVGPMLGIFIGNEVSFTALFIVASIITGASFLAVLFISSGKRDPELAAQAKAQGFTLRSFFLPKAALTTTFMFLMAFAYMAINSFLNSYAIELGLEFFAPFTFLMFATGNLIFRPIFGRVMDRHGENVIVYPSICMQIIAFIMIANAHGPFLLVLSGLFNAAGFGISLSIGQAVVIKNVRPEQTTQAIGTYFFICDGASALSPFLMGFIVGGFGYQAMLYSGAGICFLAIFAYYFTHGRKAKRPLKGENA
ncbi:MAG: MFS transporter [Coriobacteriales bacterium]|nr:MFS transporter [Coriobacteriales bacterium]